MHEIVLISVNNVPFNITNPHTQRKSHFTTAIWSNCPPSISRKITYLNHTNIESKNHIYKAGIAIITNNNENKPNTLQFCSVKTN